eukprot:NODE_8564_length_377_cov_141.229814.p2 GENE.NODE_8564_length_377_cov_141.229814~~NODE_8564_length_377_cov_141.229814.p2  ORF type:complete len:95 (-),score=32.57 NODE_8564_length_377_cov_141.229814:6-290(-)
MTQPSKFLYEGALGHLAHVSQPTTWWRHARTIGSLGNLSWPPIWWCYERVRGWPVAHELLPRASAQREVACVGGGHALPHKKKKKKKKKKKFIR